MSLSDPQPATDRTYPPRSEPGVLGLQTSGVLLFLFIPLVLVLFVRHPRPVAASLAAGVALMLGHRFAARPYMRRAISRKCVWCNRVLPAALGPGHRTLDLLAGGEVVAARSCAAHRRPAVRFFHFLDRARWPLRLGIFLPLLVLLAALGAAAFGQERTLPAATALFQLLVGVTVSAAAWGYLLLAEPRSRAPIPVPFPAHNFFLLGLHPLLWIFRLVGAWWMVRGLAFFFRV